jgi:hypothetical protein
MPLAMESRVSPWKREACARDGSARIAKAMNGINHLLPGWRDLAYERMSESFGFMVYQLAISALYIFNHVFVQKCERGVCNRLPRRFAAQCYDIVVQRVELSLCSPAKIYWTFVVHARSHFHDCAVHVSWMSREFVSDELFMT